MKKHLIKLSAIGIAILLQSCATRITTVINSQDDVVRIGPDVKGHVYVYRSGKWQDGGKCHLPEGWFAGPGPK